MWNIPVSTRWVWVVDKSGSIETMETSDIGDIPVNSRRVSADIFAIPRIFLTSESEGKSVKIFWLAVSVPTSGLSNQ